MVIGLLLVLTTITVSAVNFTMDEERIRAGARSVQSYLEGARDRAIYAREPRGVRFLLDEELTKPVQVSNNTIQVPFTVNSIVYVGRPEFYNRGSQVTLRDTNNDGDFMTVVGNQATGWQRLVARGLLQPGARIQIDETWYVVQRVFPNREWLRINQPFRGSTPEAGKNYQLQLPPQVLPEQEPELLPQGVVIDLDRSRVPRSWRRPNGSYVSQLDILFSPRGTVTGPSAAEGLIHLYLCEGTVAEALQQVPAFAGTGNIPSDFAAQNLPDPVAEALADRVLISVFTHTGNVSAHPVDATDLLNNQNGTQNPDGLADDPFRFAETGEVAAE